MKKVFGLLLLLCITSYAISDEEAPTIWEYIDYICPYPYGLCG